MKLTPERIAEIRAAEAAATAGPWRANDEYIYDTTRRLAACNGREEVDNAAFIAAARTAIPDLLSDRRAMIQEIATLKLILTCEYCGSDELYVETRCEKCGMTSSEMVGGDK